MVNKTRAKVYFDYFDVTIIWNSLQTKYLFIPKLTQLIEFGKYITNEYNPSIIT